MILDIRAEWVFSMAGFTIMNIHEHQLHRPTVEGAAIVVDVLGKMVDDRDLQESPSDEKKNARLMLTSG